MEILTNEPMNPTAQPSQTSIKKRKYEMGRPATPCKLGAKRVRSVRCRGGNM